MMMTVVMAEEIRGKTQGASGVIAISTGRNVEKFMLRMLTLACCDASTLSTI